MGGAATAMLSSTVAFALSDLFAKRLGAAGVPAPELVLLRLVCLALWLGWLMARGARLRPLRHPMLQGLRGLCIVGSSLIFITALARLPLAMATTLAFSSPIFVTLLSVWLLRERVRVSRWTWVVVGFAGVLTVAAPPRTGFDAAVLLPVASSIVWSLGMICTRRIGSADDAFTTQVCTCAIGLACSGLALGGEMRAPALLSRMQWLEVLAMGLCWTFAQWQVLRAYTQAQASAMAPLSYTQMIWAGLLAWFVLQQPPTLRTMVGSVVIALAGFGMLRTQASQSWPGPVSVEPD